MQPEKCPGAESHKSPSKQPLGTQVKARGCVQGAANIRYSVPAPHGITRPPTSANELGRGTKMSVEDKNVQAPCDS